MRMAALPAPIEPESSSVPRNHRFRFDDYEGGPPAIPELRKPGPEHAIRNAELYFVGTLRTFENQELVTKGQDLRMERSSVAKSLPNRIDQREDDREPVARNVSGSASKFNRLNQYGVFGRDRR